MTLKLPLRVNARRLLRTIEELSKIGRNPRERRGITRKTFSDADMRARRYVHNLMRESGLEVYVDRFANMVGTRPGVDGKLPAVVAGSYIDSVPNGGRLYGAYGVLSAIEAVRVISETNTSTKNPVCVVVFTEEEGCRFPAYLGSRGFVGALSRREAYSLKDEQGVSFEKAMIDAGIDPSGLVTKPWKPGDAKCYLELHIEQGPILENEKITIGVVESIVGNATVAVRVVGSSGHVGTVPMSLRRDALVGASKKILRSNRVVARSRTSVLTVGSVSVAPNASNVIPAEVMFSIDFRDHRLDKLRALRKEITSLVGAIGKQHGLGVDIEEGHFARPANMSRKVTDTVLNTAQSLGLRHMRMNSGAGHDAQILSSFTKTGMIFIPSQEGRSHTPDEYSAPREIEAGANVLLNSILQLSGAGS